ncbi:MAG: sulfite exporter TauE/SafE family protein [Pseudomonadota bacterium]|nr:sulfite exporter TauE/SafE family protein [Pseudomonadota bacterium]MDP1905747.1 sulfite exporter TauE/SafE family protein [Pseudomonadota bacterium]MDP2352311.1 sulfite exporter TauE/SafE family protein [Pseudomonadota bacterium]
MPADFDLNLASAWLPLSWGVLVGFVFSLVGAAGGILASFGLISVLGLSDANQVKPMAQMLTLATPLVAVPNYLRQCRLVFSLGLVLAAGGLLGALVGSALSVRYLSDMSSFKPVFAILVLIIAVQLVWSLARSQAGQGASARAAAAFEGLVATGSAPCEIGVRHTIWSWRRIQFAFGGEMFDYSPVLAFAIGFCIAALASALGVGGGFLLVPFMAMGLRLPMFVVAGTAALAVFVSSSASIANYLAMGVRLNWELLPPLLLGTLIGAYLGPYLSRYFRDSWLRGVLVVVLTGIGLKYLLA